MKCRVCGIDSPIIFRAKILKKYYVSYFHCDHCGFLQTEEPYWLEEAYKEPINRLDTGVLARNLYHANVSSAVLFFLIGKNANCLDYGGGYGVLTRLLRDKGFDCVWHDKHADNLFARGFEYCQGDRVFEAVTCFEVFEHFLDPVEETGRILGISRNLLFSTELLPPIPPPPDRWWYYGLEHGQHISWYSLRTLKYIAKTHGLILLSNGKSIHLMTDKKISAVLFRILVALSPYGLGILPRLFMGSRTLPDSELLSEGVPDRRPPR